MKFDKQINRLNTNSLKFDFKQERNKPNDVLPMWIADMDFKCCNKILKDMHKKVNHGIFGYTKTDIEYFLEIEKWYKNNFGVKLESDWLISTPGIVFALATAVKAITNENDYVLINSPVYYPFSEVVEDNKRKIVSSDLVNINNHYEINFEDFENKIKEYKVKLFLLCSPHNPVGRVWTKNDLDKIVAICKKHNVFIVSDEIHSDFVWKEKHINIINYTDYLDHIILCTSPAKTFNLAGLQTSNIFIPNKNIRTKFQDELWNTGYSLINTMGLVACKSAYHNGQKWLDKLKKYLTENIDFLDNFLKTRLPKIKLIYPEATYLLWLDFNALNLTDDEIEKIMLNDAKLWLDNGNMFGNLGKGFQRMNIALPRKHLKQALINLEHAFNNY